MLLTPTHMINVCRGCLYFDGSTHEREANMEKLFEPIYLRGDDCSLVPLSIEHLHGLVESVCLQHH